MSRDLRLRELELLRERARRLEAEPIRQARLWRPRCERWRGVPDDPRPAGCGAEMAPDAEEGVFFCSTCAIREHRTSQKDALRALVAPGVLSALLGGANRAGKTESGVLLSILSALGADNQSVAAFLAANALPSSFVPKGPGTVVLSALSFNDSIRYHRSKLDRWLPKSAKKHNWNAENEASVTFAGGGRIILKSASQGREKFQGDAVRLVVLDEEHPEDIHEECLRATAEENGLILTTATPLKGLTWAYDAFVATPREGYATQRIYGLDNPYVDSSSLVRRFASLEEHKKRARLYGEWAAAEGRIWPAFSRNTHVIPDFPIPLHWDKRRIIDFGDNFACVWMAIDPKGTVYVYKTLKTQGRLLSENARLILQRSEGEIYTKTLADPAALESRRTLAAHHEIPTNPARKDVEAGIDAVGELLYPNPAPRLYVFASAAPPLQSEIESYRRDKKGEVIKTNDHLCDCLRYGCFDLLHGDIGVT